MSDQSHVPGEPSTVTVHSLEECQTLQRHGWVVVLYHDGTNMPAQSWVMEEPTVEVWGTNG